MPCHVLLALMGFRTVAARRVRGGCDIRLIDPLSIDFGEFHDQGDAKWMVIWRQLRGHIDTPFGRPTPGRPIGRPEVGHPQAVFWCF
jgi:hypothetical protein